MWVKVYVTESESPAELHHLVTDDPAVPHDASETETEWAILQAGPAGAANGELANEGQAGAASKSVTRRYEFYQYTGAYDPESHEVLCGGGGGGAGAAARQGGSCSAPLPGELGNYIGAQMAAINLEPAGPTPTATPLATATPTVAAATPTATTAAICVGNCNGDSSISIDELIKLVNIALGSAQPADCASGIPAGSAVDISMLVRAVDNALRGCPS